MIAGVIAVGLVLIIMLFIHQLLDSEKHMIFQLLLIVFVMVGALLVLPKMVIDETSVCDLVINQTESVGAFITYTYRTECFTNDTTTGSMFYKITSTMFWLFIAYLTVFLTLWSVFKLRDSISGGKRG